MRMQAVSKKLGNLHDLTGLIIVCLGLAIKGWLPPLYNDSNKESKETDGGSPEKVNGRYTCYLKANFLGLGKRKAGRRSCWMGFSRVSRSTAIHKMK
jgi:hypothetical protein